MQEKPWYASDFTHIRIPKPLFWCPPYNTLTPEAKLLYGALLDRTSLSAQHKAVFTTHDGQIYIYYTLISIMDLLGCGHDKATSVLRELRNVNLIETRRRGIGRPYQIIVKPIDWGAVRLPSFEIAEEPM